MSDKEREEFEAWATAQRFINVPFGETGVLPTVASIEMSWQASAARYQSRIADVRSLTKELDIALNGVDGCAEQASLCDIVAQVKRANPLSRIAELEAALIDALAKKPKRLFEDPITADNVRKAIASGFAACEASDGSAVFINTGEEPDYGHLNCPACGGSGHVGDTEYYTNRLAELEAEVERLKDAAMVEREACAIICEQSEIPFDIDLWANSTKKQMTSHTAIALAGLIRARSDKPDETMKGGA